MAFKDLQTEILEQFSEHNSLEQREFDAAFLFMQGHRKRAREQTRQRSLIRAAKRSVKQAQDRAFMERSRALLAELDERWSSVKASSAPVVVCCTICEEEFGSSAALGSHFYRKHVSTPIIPLAIVCCRFCRVAFSSSTRWREHVQREHPQKKRPSPVLGRVLAPYPKTG